MMEWQVTFRDEPNYLLVGVSGLPTLDEMLQVVDQIALRIPGRGRVLIDLRGVRTMFGFTQQFSMGTRVAQALASARVASLVPSPRRTGVSQKAANHQGARLQVFTEEAEAIAWLTTPDQ